MSFLIRWVFRLWMLILKTRPLLPTAAECFYVRWKKMSKSCCVLSVCAASHLFVQTGLDMKRFVRHDEVPGGFNRGRHSLAFWSVLDLPEHQLHHAPVGRSGGQSTNNQIKNWNLKRLIFFHSATVLRLFKGKCSWRWTPQASRWDSPFAYFSVLALSAERLDLKLHGTLLQKKKREEVSPSCDCSLHHFDSSVRFLPCRHHGPLAEGPLSKAGCQGTVTTNQHCSQWISLYYRLLYWVILSFT